MTSENSNPCVDCPLAIEFVVEDTTVYVCKYPCGLPWCVRSDEEGNAWR